MSDLHVELCSGQRPGKDRVRIPLDEDYIGFFFLEDFFDAQHYFSGLFSMAPGAGIEVITWIGELKCVEKGLVHLRTSSAAQYEG